MNICILTTATRDYIQFVPELYQSIERYFLNGHRISYLLFTDHDTFNAPVDNVRLHKIAHEPWPMMTLKRYHFHLLEREFIQKHDYVFYLDVDMLICDTVGDEILRDSVGASHPILNFHYCLPVDFTFERSPGSLACIPKAVTPFLYYYGAFQGGTTKRYLKMAEALVKTIDDDLARETIANYHDESHLNKYLYDHPPSLALTPDFISAKGYEKIYPPRITKIMMLLAQFACWLNKHQTPLTKTTIRLLRGIVTHYPVLGETRKAELTIMKKLLRSVVTFFHLWRSTDKKPKIIALHKNPAFYTYKKPPPPP